MPAGILTSQITVRADGRVMAPAASPACGQWRDIHSTDDFRAPRLNLSGPRPAPATTIRSGCDDMFNVELAATLQLL